MDITKYDRVIKNVLSNLKVKEPHRSDMSQECYLSLLSNQSKLEAAEPDDDKLAFAICKRRILYLWREQNKQIRTDSMTDPRVLHRALNVSIPDLGVTEEQLYSAIYELEDLDEFRVVYNIFIDGKTEEQTASELGMSRWVVQRRKAKGIQNLQKYFEGE